MTEYKLQKCVSYLHHVYLSICLFTCNNSRAAERIFMKIVIGDLYQNLFTYFVFGYFYFIIPASVCKIQTSKKDTVHNFSVLLLVYVSLCFHLRRLNIGYIRLDKPLPSRTLPTGTGHSLPCLHFIGLYVNLSVNTYL